MDIVIPTLGRYHKQTTYDNMPPDVQRRTNLVVQAHEEDHYRDHGYNNLIVLPERIKDISTTRRWLMHTPLLPAYSICMMDDDLVFSARRKDEPTKFRPMEERDWRAMMIELTSRTSKQRPHVGISHREGANRNVERYVTVGRQMRVLCYHKPTLNSLGISFGRMPVMEDFDITLQLLRRGYPNLLLNWYVHNQGGSDTTGGCSTFRTPQLQEECAKKLASLHPGFVKVVKKKTKTSWGGEERTDVTVYWKKAFKSYIGEEIEDYG